MSARRKRNEGWVDPCDRGRQVWAQVVKVFTAPERTVGCGGRQRAGEEKNVGVECSTGQRAAANHLSDSRIQEVFLLVVESSREWDSSGGSVPVRALAQ